MEKNLIEKWVEKIEKSEAYHKTILLEKKVTSTSAQLIFKVNADDKNEETIWYNWEHQLYVDAKESLENKDWFIHSAFQVEGGIVLTVRSKEMPDFLYEASFSDERDNGGDLLLCVFPATFTKEGEEKQLSSRSAILFEREYKETRKNIEQFFYHWLKEKHPNRLRFLLEKEEIRIVRDDY